MKSINIKLVKTADNLIINLTTKIDSLTLRMDNMTDE